MKRFRTLGALALLAVVPACLDMDVVNQNQPDADRALSSPSDVEALLSTGYYRFWNGTQKYLSLPMSVSAHEITSSWGNWGMQDRGTRPRIAWDNSPTYSNRGMLTTPWSQLYQAISNVTDGIVALEGGLDFVGPDGEDLNPRALAYARFVQGVAHGWLAMTFDRAIIFDETVNLEDGVPQPSPYTEVMAAAQGYLEEAIAIAEANTFQLPEGDNSWISERPLTNTELAQWAHSYLARYLAAVARTPAERASVDWARVVFHAERGVPEKASVEADGAIWWWAAAERPASWIRIANDLIGPADESGAYEAWRATPVQDRNSIIIETSDRRIHGEAGPTSPGTYVSVVGTSPFRSERGNYFQSRYFQERFAYHRATQFRGEMLAVQRTELDLLRAEARLRANDVAGAVNLINITRVDNGQMAPLAGTISADEAWKWLKYEKLIEVANTQGGLVYWERRGWGDLVCGTPIHYPVPGTELEQLEIPLYTFGGDGDGAATPSTGCMADSNGA